MIFSPAATAGASFLKRHGTKGLRCLSSLAQTQRQTTRGGTANACASTGVPPIPALRPGPGLQTPQGWFRPARAVLDPGLPGCERATNNLADLEEAVETIVEMRNGRRPKKSNKGSRPCSHVGRRRKKEKVGKRSRGRG